MTSEHPDPELIDYRPVNRVAVAALLAGLAAPLALVHPMLWCVPVAGAVLAVVALVSIRRSDVPTIGRKGAIFGLVLSLVFLAAAPTRYFTYDYWLGYRADLLAQHWFDLIRTHQPQKAYGLMFHTIPKHLDEPPTPGVPEQSPYEKFLAEAPVAKLIQLGNQAHPIQAASTFVGPLENGFQTVYLWYQVEPAKDESSKPYVVHVQEQRRILADGREQWLVMGVMDTRRDFAGE